MTSRKDKKSGFTLLEMVIALGISSIALSGFLSMSNMLMERTQARLISSQALAVASAARGFVMNNKTAVLAQLPAINDAGEMLVVDMQTMGYLPADFVNQNAYGQSYTILVKREDAGTPGPDSADMLVILVVTTGGKAIADKMGLSLVAGMGAAGGFIFSDAPSIARGAAGGWQVDLSGAGWSSIAGYTPAAGTLALLANILPTGVGGAVVSGGGGGGGGEGGGLLDENAPCNEANKGGMRWNETAGSLQLCDGTNWKTILAAVDPADGDPSIPVPGGGYFVLTNTVWNGNLGSMSGANDKCLTDLTTYNWLGKSDASSRGLLTSEHVRVWLTQNYYEEGNEGNPNTTYSFAVSNDLTAGGATFTTDADGSGPGNAQNWSGINYFNGSKTYWSNRDNYDNDTHGDPETDWRRDDYDSSSSCYDWDTSSSATYGKTGLSAATDHQRFDKVGVKCNQTRRLICWVNP